MPPCRWQPPPQAGATGLATCDSGPEEGWQPSGTLVKRVEADFHPKTLDPVPTKPR